MRFLLTFLAAAFMPLTVVAQDIDFTDWITSFRPTALAAGIAPETYDRAMEGVVYRPRIIELDRSQNEFTRAIWDYLDSAVSDHRIQKGRAALADHTALLDHIEQTYAVDRHILLAIWGLESAYGAVRGDSDVLSAMATLAFDGRRGAFFETQLIAALTILDAGSATVDDLRGSWAGAMGHTQFMPRSYLDFAVDGDGDGDRDIWSDDPTDALASAAHYLQQNGWTFGQPWGVEVRLPDGFDYASARRENTLLPSQWAARGVTDLTGAAVPDHGPASVLLPAGAGGAVFLIFDNFEVLESYNTADAYVIGVGHLGDRILGGPAIATPWPRQDRVLTYAERIELQQRLTAAGFDTQKIDGLIGPLTINAIRAYQLDRGLTPDGYASPGLLEGLR